MNSFVDTSWVKPPQQIGGLDHLGVQAPCIQIYGDLLPGITNQTNRARYYSFYPWLLTEFEKRGWRSDEQLRLMLRRAECLLTLISLTHGHSEEGPQEIHGAAMVGSDILSGAAVKIQQGESLLLSNYAHSDNGPLTRYFAHKYGALGQYYFGTLRDMGILAGESVSKLRIPKETGAALAAIVAKYVPGEKFIETLSNDKVNLALLSNLAPFCSCQLKQAFEEIHLLVALMLKGWPALHPEGEPSAEEILSSKSRSQSLAYICIMANAMNGDKTAFDIGAFRGIGYTVHTHSAQPLPLPSALSDQANKWQAYQRNELLSIALQGLFFSQLKAVELSNLFFANTSELSQWFWTEGFGGKIIISWKGNNADDGLSALARELPNFGEWKSDKHEIQSMKRIGSLTQISGIGQLDILTIISDSLTILAALIYRPENANGYAAYRFPENYLAHYPVNLNSTLSAWRDFVGKKPRAEGLALFTQINCLDAHLQVALRKLRQQSTNTFRFEPREGALAIKAIPQAANTSPRFRQAIRILLDLDLLEENGKLLNATKSGLDFIEAAL